MNVFILTDMEGIAAVTDLDYLVRANEKYAVAQKELCRELNLAVEACFQMGAENVYYLDGHGGGGNVIDELVDPRAVKCTLTQWDELLMAGKIDCQIELGAHARAGTMTGFLDHTIGSREFFLYTVGGVEMSELSLHALVCGGNGVPVVACTGDETACKQAKEYIPQIAVGAVKTADCRNFATKYDNADEVIVNAVKEGLANYQNIPPYTLPLPAEVQVIYTRTDYCEDIYKGCGEEVTRVDARTLRKTVDSIRKYPDIKFW